MRSRGNAVPIKRIREELPCLMGSRAWKFLEVAGKGLRDAFRPEAAFHASSPAATRFAHSARPRVPESFWFGGHSRGASVVTAPRRPIIFREDSPCRR